MSSGNIIVTGFGPFGEHSVNASWESVKLLPDQIENYCIIKEELSVSYDVVDQKVLALWKAYDPELVIHVGVSSFTSKITLETCAYKQGYIRKDIYGKCPLEGSKWSEQSDDCIYVSFDVKDICNQVQKTTSFETCLSNNAGRYLCEYVLYTSLCIDKNKAMFVHVPPLGRPYSEQDLAEAIKEIICSALRQRKCNRLTS